MSKIPLVLASSSPRRLALLKQIGILPDKVVSPDIDETILHGELARDHAKRLARTKAHKIEADIRPAYVLAADTVVACGRRILPKTDDAEVARKCLLMLSGKRHRVWGGICIMGPKGTTAHRTVMTQVRFKRLSPQEIDNYLASGEWQGKAGGYAIQGLAARYIPWINGSYDNVVGLALSDAISMLEGLGWRP